MAEMRYGVRISGLDGRDIILVEQTCREHPGTGNNPYVLPHPDGKRYFKHVHRDADNELAMAVRAGLSGKLPNSNGECYV